MSLLRARLRAELAGLTHVALGQRQVIVQEMQHILQFVVQRNNLRLQLAARKFYLDGWRQVNLLERIHAAFHGLFLSSFSLRYQLAYRSMALE